MDAATALRVLLDQVDYTAGACRPNEMVGAVVSRELLQQCKDALKEQKK